MSNWQRDFLAIFLAVVLAEITVILIQSMVPGLAERVRMQTESWFPTQAMPDGAEANA